MFFKITEGPMSHDQPTYASVPGIRVYGMMCVQGNRRGRPLRNIRSILGENLQFFKTYLNIEIILYNMQYNTYGASHQTNFKKCSY